MKRILVCTVLIALGLGWGAKAEGFTIGLALGLPTLAEVRLGYTEQAFGARLYAGSFLITAVGVDGYARVPTDWGAWRVGGGLAYFNEGFTDTSWLAVRALLGAELRLSDAVALTLEWRPGYPVLLASPNLSGSTNGARDNLLQYLLLALNLEIEFRV